MILKRDKLGRFVKGHIPSNKGKKSPSTTKRNLENNPMKNPEIAKKQGETRKRLYKENKLPTCFKKGHPQFNTGRTHFQKGKCSGKNGSFYGRVHSKKTLIKMSANQHGIDIKDWKGFTSFEPYDERWNRKFKNLIRKRDNQICMLCNIHREKLKEALNVHHINYNKKLTIPQNCISLCRSCHIKTQYNRLHWTKFFQSLLLKRYNYQYDEIQNIKIKVKVI